MKTRIKIIAAALAAFVVVFTLAVSNYKPVEIIGGNENGGGIEEEGNQNAGNGEQKGSDGKEKIYEAIEAQPEYDYFAETYKGIEPGHVLQSIVYDELFNLLGGYLPGVSAASQPNDGRTGAGDYAIFFGGAWDDYTRGVLPYINLAAKKNDIKKVYVFDPKLDGGLSESIVGRITSGTNAGRIGYSAGGVDYLYDDFDVHLFKTGGGVGDTLLKKLNDQIEGGDKLTASNDQAIVTPLLIAVNRAPDTAGTANSARYSTIYGTRVSTKFTYQRSLVGNIASEYSAELDAFFAQIQDEGDFDVFTTKNRDDITGGGTTHLDENKYFQTVTYAQLIALLESPGEHIILFGGTWCPNTAALYYEYQNAAKRAGFKGKIYLFDARLDGSTGNFNIRNNENGQSNASSASGAGTHARLYAHLLDNYFTDYWSVWNSKGTLARPAAGGNAAASDAVFTINGKLYTRMCIPNIFLYNRDIEGGIVDSFESELTWANVKAKTQEDKTASEQKGDGVNNQYQFLVRSTENLFAKLNLSYYYTLAGYTLTSRASGLDVTLTAVKGSSYAVITAYYKSADALAALASLKSRGIEAFIDGNTVYYGDQDALAVKDGKAPAESRGGAENPGGEEAETPVIPAPGGNSGEQGSGSENQNPGTGEDC